MMPTDVEVRQPSCAPYDAEILRCARLLESIDALQPRDVVRTSGPAEPARLVSVVLPMWNAGEFVERCLKALLLQTYPHLEIFCVDDKSSDDTYSRVVEQFGKDSRVCVIRLARTVGPYQIKNWVFSQLARGELIAMQDADDVSHPRRIATQLRFMSETGADVCGTSIHQFFRVDTPPRFGGRWVTVSAEDEWQHSLAIYSSLAPSQDPLPYSEILGEDRHLFVAKHGSQLFRKSLLQRFGGFDGRTRIGADTDLNWRLLRFLPVMNVPDVMYSRRHHHASLTRHPETGINSPLRNAYLQRRDREHEEIRMAVERREMERVRRLCTQDCYFGEVEVEEIHANWDVEAGCPARP
jgi:glycosyltransferase involved in cell wall biosynthesis